MNKQEAYKILEISSSASEEEIKKQYKKLAKKWHPDSNKDPNATEKLKSVNEAYNFLKNYTEQPDQNYYKLENINTYTKISFRESVLGTKVNLKYNRTVKCDDCNGDGSLKDKSCKDCGGKGIKITRQGNSVMSQTCMTCYFSNKTPCSSCNQLGYKDANISVSVSIPPGITNFSTLRLQGIGNYIPGNTMFFNEYTDVYLSVEVEEEQNMKIIGNNIYSECTISLLDALNGKELEVKTIEGTKKINIPLKTKNKDEIKIPKLGVANVGDHVFVINVEYPEDISSLIKLLEKQNDIEFAEKYL